MEIDRERLPFAVASAAVGLFFYIHYGFAGAFFGFLTFVGAVVFIRWVDDLLTSEGPADYEKMCMVCGAVVESRREKELHEKHCWGGEK
jgi:hypothetical protein